MRCVPRGVACTCTLEAAVGMAEHGTHAIRRHALLGLIRRRRHGHGVRGPVVARVVDAIRERTPAGVRARQDVVLAYGPLAAAAGHDSALLVQHGRLPDGIAVALLIAVQVGNAARDHLPFGIEPRPVADAAARIDLRHAGTRLRAEIGVPRLVACAGRGGEVLADLIGAREPAEIACSAWSLAGDKETHRLLRLLLGPKDSRRRAEHRHGYG